MFTEQEIKIANATSRTNGASARNKDGSPRAIVPNYIANNAVKEVAILDFGSGKDAAHTQWLREQGFNCTAYDFGDNYKEGVHDKNALSKQYKMIFASNVLNVSSSLKMLMETLIQIYNCLETDGELIANYPSSPRKMILNADDMKTIIENIFNSKVERIGGTKSAPMWKVCKPFVN